MEQHVGWCKMELGEDEQQVRRCWQAAPTAHSRDSKQTS